MVVAPLVFFDSLRFLLILIQVYLCIVLSRKVDCICQLSAANLKITLKFAVAPSP